MEERKEITQEAATRLIYQALYELELGNEATRMAEEEISRLRESICGDKELGETGRQKMLAYIRQLAMLNDRQYRHLYKQGGKDCVTLLQKLGVLPKFSI